MNDTTSAEINRLHDGRHLRAARILAGLTQQQLANAAGLHVNAVRYWEADNRSSEPWGVAIERLVAALRRYGVEVAALFGDDKQLALVRRQQLSIKTNSLITDNLDAGIAAATNTPIG
jgi:transcriptional regulator with XRE-family HTH domain